MTERRAAGRPRSFDEDTVLDRAVDVFWTSGAVDTTTRVLESELGVTQSSLYNAFGSKDALMHRSIDRYLERVADELLEPLELPGATPDDLERFIRGLVDWISTREHPGCLLLNLLGERADSDESIVERATAYRTQLRSAFANALAPAGPDDAAGRADLVLAAVLGLNLAARGRADAAEMGALADALIGQIRGWT